MAEFHLYDTKANETTIHATAADAKRYAQDKTGAAPLTWKEDPNMEEFGLDGIWYGATTWTKGIGTYDGKHNWWELIYVPDEGE